MLKSISGLLFGCMGGLIACNPSIVDPFDAGAHQEEEIALIENYLAENGYTQYDTLQTGTRIFILEKGTGDIIKYNDNIQFDFIGKLLNDTIFDTSIAQLAYDQDALNITDSIHVKDDQGKPVLDKNGLLALDSLKYREGYTPVYSIVNAYEPLITTHSSDGWFLLSHQPLHRRATGLPLGIHQVLEQINIGGRGLIFLPSALGYGPQGSLGIAPNTVIIFEIRPIRIR